MCIHPSTLPTLYLHQRTVWPDALWPGLLFYTTLRRGWGQGGGEEKGTYALAHIVLRIKVNWSTFQRQGQESGCSSKWKDKEFKLKALVLKSGLEKSMEALCFKYEIFGVKHINLHEEYIK